MSSRDSCCSQPKSSESSLIAPAGLLDPAIKPKDAVTVAKPAGGAGWGKGGSKPAPAPGSAPAGAAPATLTAVPASGGAPAAAAASPAVAEAFAKVKLAVGLVTSVGFVEGSDKLYLCKASLRHC